MIPYILLFVNAPALVAGVLFFGCVHELQQLHEPLRAAAAYRSDFPVAVLCYQHEAVVIIVEFRLVTIWQP